MEDNSTKKPSGGQFKSFKYTENQELWDRFFAHKVEEAKVSGKEYKRKPEMSIAQYKPGLLTLEALTEKKFSDITADDLTMLDIERQGKNMMHVKGFFITAISEGWMKPIDKELVVYLIPAEYRKLVNIIFE